MVKLLQLSTSRLCGQVYGGNPIKGDIFKFIKNAVFIKNARPGPEKCPKAQR